MDELEQMAKALVAQGQEAFGFNDDVAQRELLKLISSSSQTQLFGAMENAMGSPGYFSSPRALFEAGTGAGGFLLSALGDGHDAWGIDNDPKRLAVAHARIRAFSMPSAWEGRALEGDATDTGMEAERFDVVLGHQFIEHVPDPAGTICELLRVTKRGGYLVLFAPDYRAPFEAHYEIPWPPFLSRAMCEAWLDGFDRPYGGLDYFFYTTAPQIVAILQSMNCTVVNAYNDRHLEPQVHKHFDCSSLAATKETAKRMRAAFEARTLPVHFTSATSFGIVAQKT